MADEVGPLQPGLPPRTVGERRHPPQGGGKPKPSRPRQEEPLREEDEQAPKLPHRPPRGGIIDEYV
jgi:hypothetical protein